MGRYYTGDIEGKMSLNQSSDDADFFGVEGRTDDIYYYFDKDDLPLIDAGISKCHQALKEGGDTTIWKPRLVLGNKIKRAVEKNGSCAFTVET